MTLLLFSIILIFIYLFTYFNMDSMARNYLRGHRSCFIFLWLFLWFSFLIIIFIYFDMALICGENLYSDRNFSVSFFLLYMSIFIITIFSLFICIFLLLLLLFLFLYPFVYLWFFGDTIGNISAFFSFKFECFIALGVFFSYYLCLYDFFDAFLFEFSLLFCFGIFHSVSFSGAVILLMIFFLFLKHFYSKYLYVSLLLGSFSP